MLHRIEITSLIQDMRALARKKRLCEKGFPVTHCSLVDVYTLDAALSPLELEQAARMLANPVTQSYHIDAPVSPESFDFALEIGFLPGVTDTLGSTAQESVEDLLNKKMGETQAVYSSQITFLSGTLTTAQVEEIAQELSNPLIQQCSLKQFSDFARESSRALHIPKVRLGEAPQADTVEICAASDEELERIGKQGIANPNGSRRGPLALDLAAMKTIQAHFQKLGRNPSDVELESIAQTWSEHCKHTIFARPLAGTGTGIFAQYIQRATETVRKQKGDKDFCVSVFTDNSGAIAFDENYLITDKAETHNSPSALDPFGGALTGIVGVNRDTIGFGLGALPVINRFGFCFADPATKKVLYKEAGKNSRMRSPRLIMEGVIDGVNAGGNQSGIPTPQGFMLFDPRYQGKPLVFVGTVGLLPREAGGRKLFEKKARAGDYIVMAGGAVGKDGIHGATFSSEALDSGSPATAVQIGCPITQKKLSDALIREARDKGLYTSITDNGAGGLSCSVAEMARECNGCRVNLDQVPLKYPGMSPWEIWVSESQERMTLAVPPACWDELHALLEKRGVYSAVIGEFTNTGRCVVQWKEKSVMDLDLEFLHHGVPLPPLSVTVPQPSFSEPFFPFPDDCTHALMEMMARLNVASISFVSQQYDHEVQGGSVTKPLQGGGRVNADATVTRPLRESFTGVVVSQGILPWYSDISTYHMAACSLDTAVRNAICAGANPEKIALMDNFCWCSPQQPERLGELVEAARACYECAVAYGTPFISGKDSMYNDFTGFDDAEKPVKISIPPTLLVSSLGIIDDARTAITLDAKIAGDRVYVLGETHDELGASEYYALAGEKNQGTPFVGNRVPAVNAQKNKQTYAALARAIREGLVASAISVNRGGLGVALAKCAVAGKKGMALSLAALPGSWSRDDFALFSESQGRVVVTVAEKNVAAFESTCSGISCSKIGTVQEDGQFTVAGNQVIVSTTVEALQGQYDSRFGGL